MADEPTVLQSLDAGVLLLTLNRPAANNGWNTAMEEEYFNALAAAAENPEVRAIVVTGAGRAFCPGMDTQVLDKSSKGQGQPPIERRPMTFPTMIPKPVIGAINGACAGIGLIQAMCCDVRFAQRGIKITTAFVRRGLPAENGVTWLMTRLVGRGVATDLLLSGRVVLAEEAAEIGLMNFLTEPGEVVNAAVAYAKDLAANCSPLSMAVMKRQIYTDLEGTLNAARTAAIRHVEEMRDQPDFREGIASFIEKRAPEFPPYTERVYVVREVTPPRQPAT
jgi:enoyl-CoA hydratase/carnithine racemase